MSITLKYHQAKAILAYFEASKYDENDKLEDAALVVVKKESFPKLEGPEGLYAYDPQYPDEGLIYLG